MSSPSEAGPSSRRAPVPRRGRGSTFILLLLTSIGAVVYFVSARSPEVAENSFLEVVLEDPLTDAPRQGGLFLDPADAPPVLTEIVAAIRRAKDDPRIDGVFLRLDGGSTGF